MKLGDVTVSWLLLKKEHQEQLRIQFPIRRKRPHHMICSLSSSLSPTLPSITCAQIRVAKFDNSRGHFFCNLLIFGFVCLDNVMRANAIFMILDTETEERGTLRQYRSATDNAAKTSDS